MLFSKKAGTLQMRHIFKSVIDNLIYIESRFHKTEAVYSDRKRRVLILRKDGLGDCIIFYPTLAAYREFYKGDEITALFPKAFESLSPLLDSIDKVIWFDAERFSRNLLYRRRFLLDLKKKGYDIAIYPVYSREQIGDMMIMITAARETVGFKGGDDSMYSRTITPPDHMRLEMDRDIYFAEEVTGKKSSIAFPTIDIKRLPLGTSPELVRRYSLDKNSFVIVFPGAGGAYKIWPPERFAAIIDYLAGRNMTPVLCGNPAEIELSREILSHARHADKAVNLSGQTDLPTLAHLLTRSKLYFGSDTGILHLAIALGTPSVALTWRGSYGRFFPYGDLSRNVALHTHYGSSNETDTTDKPLLELGKLHPSIEDISVEQALEELEKAMRANTFGLKSDTIGL